MKDIYVLYTSNDRYAAITGISILSMLEHHKTEEKIHVYILNDEISGANQEKLTVTVQKYGSDIVFVDSKYYIDQLRRVNAREYFNSLMGYGSMFAGEIFPAEAERGLFVDGDTMFVRDISELNAVNLNGKACGMTIDCINHRYLKYIGLHENQFYFNDGIIVFDLQGWRQRQILQYLLKYLEEAGTSFPMVEQDLYNVIMPKDICKIDIKYNFVSSWLVYQYSWYSRNYGIEKEQLSEKEYNEGKNPVIYHFAGNMLGRPWFRNSRHPAADEYAKLISQSEWNSCDEWFSSEVPFPYKVVTFFSLFFPTWVNGILGYILQRLFMWKSYRC